jgi:hypothetical protein
MPGNDANGPTPDNAGDGAGGGNVIAFPGRLRPVADASAPKAEDAAARLDRALLALAQALARQQEAVQAWRQGLGDLASSLSSLANGLCALDTELQAATARLKTGMDENGREVVKPADPTEGATPAPEQPLDPLLSGK